MNKHLPIVAVILASAALIIAINSRTKPQAMADGVAIENTGLKQQVAALEKKVLALEQSHIRQLAESAGHGSSAEVLPSAVKNLERQITDLSAKQQELEEFTKGIDSMGVIKATERQIKTAYAKLMDKDADTWTRVKQANLLKRYGQFDENAVTAMQTLWNEAETPKEKGAVLGTLKGHVTPEFRDEIFDTLRAEVEGGNKSGYLRYYAIEALEPLLPDPGVQEWLDYLANNDPEPKIASRAARPLGIETDPDPSEKK